MQKLEVAPVKLDVASVTPEIAPVKLEGRLGPHRWGPASWSVLLHPRPCRESRLMAASRGPRGAATMGDWGQTSEVFIFAPAFVFPGGWSVVPLQLLVIWSYGIPGQVCQETHE